MTDPLRAFQFRVDWGGTRMGFSEVTGLDMEIGVIEYREGNSKVATPRKLSGMYKYGNVTLKRGVILGDNDFFAWVSEVRGSDAGRRDVTISLLNDDHEPVTTWKLVAARPMKYTAPELKASGNEVAIESLEICHEGLTVVD